MGIVWELVRCKVSPRVRQVAVAAMLISLVILSDAVARSDKCSRDSVDALQLAFDDEQKGVELRRLRPEPTLLRYGWGCIRIPLGLKKKQDGWPKTFAPIVAS